MSHLINKTFTCIFVALFLFSTVAVACGGIYYSSSYSWGFQNYAYLNFNQVINFTDPPHLGSTINDSLVTYWSMDEGKGLVVLDASGNSNSGTIYNATWVAGKYGDALNFDGVSSYVSCGYIVPPAAAITISAWVKSSATQEESIIGLDSGHRFIYISNGNTLQYWWKTTGLEASRQLPLPSSYLDDAFHFVVFTYDNSTGNAKVYWDNQLLDNYFFGGDILPSTDHYQTSIGARLGSTNKLMNGIIDDVRIYNRALDASEVAALYEQPDPTSFVNYYNYQDPFTNNTMLIHVDSPIGNSNNIALVTCTNFFASNRLVFQANNSATLNVWTSLGQPSFTKGVWNSQNYTTTLTLHTSSTGELDWNQGTPPSASNLSASSTIAGKTAAFSALWSDNQSLSGGGYIFSTNNTGQWVNASWVPFSLSPCWGNATLNLNNSIGTIVGFREYANNSLNLWGDSGIYTITTTNDMSTPTPSSAPTASPTPTPTPTSTPTPTQTNSFPTETILIVATAIGALVAVLALAFKKGYITIEVLDEEKPQETSDDYTI